MYTWLKKSRGYIASIMLVYTVGVTYFLVRSAWNNGLDPRLQGSEDHDDATFLTDLVREERRHLQNFRDVVHNFRGEAEEGSEQNMSLEKNIHDVNHEQIYYLTNKAQRNTNESNAQMVRESSKALGSLHKHQMPVEVEEWDEGIVEKRRKERVHSVALSNKRRAMKSSRNAIDIQTVTASRSENQHPRKVEVSEYSTSYCSKIDHKENICAPERITFTHPDHMSMSKSSMMFSRLRDILIYSAFLDPRAPHKPLIRLMALGPLHPGNQSVFWCVFDSKQLKKSGRLGSDAATGQTKVKQPVYSSQLTYYAASDGHNKMYQFYIMSCEVPSQLMYVLSRTEMSEIRVVVGTKERPILDFGKEEIALPVINNFASSKAKWRTTNVKQSIYHESVHNNVNKDNNMYTSQTLYSDDEEIEINKHVDNDGFRHRQLLHNEGLSGLNSSNIINGRNKTMDSARGDGTAATTSSSSRDFLVSCVSPTHTSLSVLQMVEFFELTFLLGSQHIVMYTHSGVNDGVQSVLDMYMAQGLVTVLPWNLPSGPDSVWARGRDVALNDCLYRTMFLYDYALFHEMEEFYVPRVTPDLPSFLAFIRRKGGFKSAKYTDLVFSSSYFPPPTRVQHKELVAAPDYTKDVPKLSTLKSIHRSYISNKHPSRIINVTAAIRVGAGERQRTSFVISNRLASVNHYRQCPVVTKLVNRENSEGASGGLQTKESECDHTKTDWVMWRYKNVLIQNVKGNIRALNKILHAKKHR